MSLFFKTLSFIFFVVAICATPGAIGFGLYDWAVQDVQLSMAAWGAFKLWVITLVGGVFFGLVFSFIGCLYD